MQQSSSKESSANNSCSEIASTVPKFKCPLTLANFETVTESVPSLADLSAYTHKDFDTWLRQSERPVVRRKLLSVQNDLAKLGLTGEQRIAQLQQKLDELKRWIKESFQVEDLPAWSLQQQKEAEALKKSDSASDTATSTTSRSEEAKPMLRIKLVDDKLKTASNPTATSPLSPRGDKSSSFGGTGSKNLSRMMSRPEELKTKVTSQTPVTVFWNYVEPFFKPIEEADLRILDDAGKFSDPAPFTIPPLGKHYSEQWREQYGYNCSLRASRRRATMPMPHSGEGGGDFMGGGSPRATSLRERLLAMMIEENLTVPEPSEGSGADQNGGDAEGEPQQISPPSSEMAPLKPSDYVHVDDRIRQELSESGLCIFVPKVDYQEDDAICLELRTLQRRLREQVCINHYRKRKLAELIREKLPAQEFYTLLADIDKQIEQMFSRKLKVQKKRKKPTGVVASPSPVSASPEVANLVETRRKLIESFSNIIPSQKEFLSATRPSCDHLFEASQEERVLEFARESGNWLPVPDLPLCHVRLANPPAQPVFPALAPLINEQYDRLNSGVTFEPPTII